MGVSRLHLTAWNWFLKELIVIELVGFSRRKWNVFTRIRLLPIPALSKANPIRSFPPCLFKINIVLFSHLLVGFTSDLLPSRFLFKMFSFLIYFIHVACPMHHLTARVICSEEHSFLQLLVHVSPDSRNSWLPKNIFQSGILFLCWPHFYSSKLALNVP